MPACPAFDPLAPFATGITRFIDCHAAGLGEEGYRALGSGSPIGVAITGMLTIYVAVIGYRLMFGDGPGIRESALSAFRIGFVIALASQWPTYQSLAYNVVVHGPQELADSILAPVGSIGQDSDALTSHIEFAYRELDRAAFADQIAAQDVGGIPVAGPDGPVLPNPVASAPVGDGDTVIRAAALIFMTASLGGLLGVKLIAGLMLALGPIFIACLLFASTRGLFAGWIRVLFGAAIGSVGVAAVLGLQLAILEPQLIAMARARAINDAVPLLRGELLVTAGLFAVLMILMLAACTRAASAFHIPQAARQWFDQQISRQEAPHVRADAPAAAAPDATEKSAPRAQAVAAAVEASVRREQRETAAATAGAAPPRQTPIPPSDRGNPVATVVPLGRTHRRASMQRRSASTDRRDTRGFAT
jgi:type IV secretion system protein VirB6